MIMSAGPNYMIGDDVYGFVECNIGEKNRDIKTGGAGGTVLVHMSLATVTRIRFLHRAVI